MMIIQCPECDKKYKVAANAISSSGRLVRCTGCEYEWLVRPEDDQSLVAGYEQPIPIVDDVVEKAWAEQAILEAKTPNPLQLERNWEEKQVKPAAFLGRPLMKDTDSLNVTLGDIIPRMKEPSPLVLPQHSVWPGRLVSFSCIMLAMLILLVPITLVWHNHITRIIPTMAVLLEKFGIHDNHGLKITKVKLVQIAGTNSVDMEVNLYIQNFSTATKFLSGLRVTAYDAEMTHLGDFIMAIDEDIPMNQRHYFQGKLQSLPLATAYIAVDVGDRPEMHLRDVQYMYHFLK